MKIFGRKPKMQNTIIRRKKFSFSLLLSSVILFILLGLILYYFSPSAEFVIFSIHLSILLAFFPLLFFALFFAGTTIFRSKWQGTLIASFVVLYLTFRLNNLTNPFFFILLAALFVTLELMIVNRRD
ncbi:MAG: hypothetical protein ACREHC_07855 [Candidatus Levyibacteriota bacterium]